MKVSDLIAQLQLMPQELDVMLGCESGLDHAMGVSIAQVAKTERDWSGTPIGNYTVIDGNDTEFKTEKPFPVVVIDLEKSRQPCKENPELPSRFIQDILLSVEEAKTDQVTAYKFGDSEP